MRLLDTLPQEVFRVLLFPVPAQNSCLREYAQANDLIYVLPPLEHYFENCYMQLFTALKAMEKGDILGMYSAAMLPQDVIKLNFIFDEIKKGKEVFILSWRQKKLII